MKFLLGALSIATLTACANSPVPMADNFPASSQMKVRAAGHWQALSKDIAAKTIESLKAGGANQAVFVALPKNPTTFDKAFHGFLTTELVNSGIGVQTSAKGALTATYSAQVVGHKSVKEDFRAGKYTRVAAGLWALQAIKADMISRLAVATMGAAAAKDYSDAQEASTNGVELIVTTTIQSEDRVITQKNDVYYVEAQDTDLYKSIMPAEPTKAKEMKVVQ